MRHRLVPLLLLSFALGAPAGADPPATDLADDSFQAAQWIMFTATSRAVAGVGARLAAGDDALGLLLRDRQAAQDALQRARDDLNAALQSGGDAAAARGAITNLSGRIADLNRQLAAGFPDYAEFALPRPLTLAQAQALLAPGEAMVVVLPGPSATYVWTITASASQWHRADLGEEALAAQVSTLRAALDPSGPSRSAVPLPGADRTAGGFDKATALALYDTLLRPAEPLLHEARVLYTVAAGPLGSLPLAVLMTGPAPVEGVQPWLIRRHALVTLPSVSALSSLRTDRPSGMSAADGPGFVGIGDPDLAGPSSGPVTDTGPASIRALNPLPGTSRELKAIARAFPDSSLLLTGPMATEASLAAMDLSSARVVSFATHGLQAGDLPGLDEPALVLTPPLRANAGDDGLLLASEAARLRLFADWVILSACNTAAADGDSGAESLSGLARAFFLAGARSLLVSHWPVSDRAAALMVPRMISATMADPGLPRAMALQQAMLELADSGNPQLADPSAWAPFVLVGEGGPVPPPGQ